MASETVTLDPETISARSADLLTDFLPFDRAMVDAAIDAFLDEFEGLGSGLTGLHDLGRVVPAVVVVAASTVATTVVLRRRRRSGESWKSDDDTEAALEQFSSRSDSWKLGVV